MSAELNAELNVQLSAELVIELLTPEVVDGCSLEDGRKRKTGSPLAP